MDGITFFGPEHSGGGHSNPLTERFKQEYSSGKHPHIEDFLAGVDDASRPDLLVRLLRIELSYRAESGERIDPATLHKRFPDAPEIVAQTLAEVQAYLHDTISIDNTPRGDSGNDKPTLAEFETSFSGLNFSSSHIEILDSRFTLLQCVGRGGFGIVWRARDNSLHRDVAIKLYNDTRRCQNHDAVFTEARRAANLDHEYIVPVYEVFHQDPTKPKFNSKGNSEDNSKANSEAGDSEDRGDAINGSVCGVPISGIISKFIAGGTLEQRIRESLLDPLDAIIITIKLAKALSYAHSKGIVHRDVKPANVLMEDPLKPMLTDFGLAKFEDPHGHSNSSALMGGTVAYMAPEQAVLTQARVDRRSDIYSLGITMYQMLTGIRPSVGSTPDSIRAYHLAGSRLKPLCQVRSELPPELDAIFSKATHPNLNLRYADASEMIADLEKLLPKLASPSDEPPQSNGPTLQGSIAQDDQGPNKFNRRWFVGGGLASAVGVGALAAPSMFNLSKPSADGKTEVRFILKPQAARRVRLIPLQSDTDFPRPEAYVDASSREQKAGTIQANLIVGHGDTTSLPGEGQGSETIYYARVYPGRYLIVVQWDDKTFHEVYRTVPPPDMRLPGTICSNRHWLRYADGAVMWPMISSVNDFSHNLRSVLEDAILVATAEAFPIPNPQADSMKLKPGAADLPMPTNPMICRIPGFYLSRKLSVSEFMLLARYTKKQVFSGEKKSMLMLFSESNREYLSKLLESDGPASLLSWDQAMHFAELCGMRLPEQAELYYAASQAASGDRAIETIDDLLVPPAQWVRNRMTMAPAQTDDYASLWSDARMIVSYGRDETDPTKIVEHREGYSPIRDDRQDVALRLARSERPRFEAEDFVHEVAHTKPRANGISK